MLHITDPHLFADRDAALRGTVTYASLREVLDHIGTSAWRADHVALTGDLVQDDSAGAYEHVGALIRTLELPVLTVPGNHDVRPLMRAALPAPEFDYCGTVESNGWLLLGIDSCIDGSAGGRVSDAELERLNAVVERSAAEHVLVCLHHPPLALGSRWLDSVGLENGSAFIEHLLGTERIRGVIFGHAHQAHDSSVDTLRILGTPSTCRQFKPGSDEFALDDRPPAYRRIELSEDGSIASELVWVHDDPPDNV